MTTDPRYVLVLTPRHHNNYLALCRYINGIRLHRFRKRREKDQVSRSTKLRILQDQHYECAHCGEEFDNVSQASADHIIQYQYGGEANYHNIVMVHQRCNEERAHNYSLDIIEDHYGKIDMTMIEYRA